MKQCTDVYEVLGGAERYVICPLMCVVEPSAYLQLSQGIRQDAHPQNIDNEIERVLMTLVEFSCTSGLLASAIRKFKNHVC